MKNVVLSVVIIAALAAAGIGGTLASFSDVEKSEGNTFATGALDLTVSYMGQEYDDPDVPMILNAGGAFPECSKDATWDVHNTGEGQGTGYVYFHIKDVDCDEVINPDSKHPDGRTEPEDVAECGGWHGNIWVPGVGPLGQDCTFGDYVEVYVQYDSDGDGQLEDLIGNGIWGSDGSVTLNEVVCTWWYLGELPGCNTRDGKISMSFVDIPEGDFTWDHDEDPATDEIPMDFFPDNSPLDHWPTNALQLDEVSFTMEWGLFQTPLTGANMPLYYPTP
jgi:predicted ribosomally synthesized peptide with SipW-like signal peptide